jgi:hypothetical protein
MSASLDALRIAFDGVTSEKAAELKRLETEINAAKQRLKEAETLEQEAFKVAQEASGKAGAAQKVVEDAKAEARLIVGRTESQAAGIVANADRYGSRITTEAEAAVLEMISRIRKAGIRSL